MSLPVLLCCPLLEGCSGQAVAHGMVGPCGVADTVLPDLVVRRRRADALLLLLPGEEDGGDVTVCSLGEDGRDLGERQRVACKVNLGPVEPLRVGHGCGNGLITLTVPEIRRLFDAVFHSSACRRGTAAAHRSAPSRPQQRPPRVDARHARPGLPDRSRSSRRWAGWQAGQEPQGRAGRIDGRKRGGPPTQADRPFARLLRQPHPERVQGGDLILGEPPPPCPQVSPVRRPTAEKILTCSGCSSCPACARLLLGWAQGAARAGGSARAAEVRSVAERQRTSNRSITSQLPPVLVRVRVCRPSGRPLTE